MVSLYNPAPEEWIALFVFLGSAAWAAFTFLSSSDAFRWGMYFSRDGMYQPPFFIPELYNALRVGAWVLIGLGVFFGWREGFRSDETPPVPVSGDVPSVNNFFLLILFYLIFLIVSAIFSRAFFGAGMRHGWMGVPLFFDLATLAMAILMIIYGWKIWFLSGLLILIGAVYCLYSVIMVGLLWLYRPYDLVVTDPLEVMNEQMLSYAQNMNPGRSEQIKSRAFKTDNFYPQHSSSTITARTPSAKAQMSVQTPTTLVASAPMPVTTTPLEWKAIL